MTISVTFDFSDVEALAQDFYKLSSVYYPAAMMAGVLEAGLFFEREAKMGAPHDTGRLRASIGHGPEGVWDEEFIKGKRYIVEVGTNVEYAPYMEFGFTMSSGHVAYIKAVGGFRYVHPFTFEGLHFFQKAADRTEGILQSILERHITGAIMAGGF